MRTICLVFDVLMVPLGFRWAAVAGRGLVELDSDITIPRPHPIPPLFLLFLMAAGYRRPDNARANAGRFAMKGGDRCSGAAAHERERKESEWLSLCFPRRVPLARSLAMGPWPACWQMGRERVSEVRAMDGGAQHCSYVSLRLPLQCRGKLYALSSPPPTLSVRVRSAFDFDF